MMEVEPKNLVPDSFQTRLDLFRSSASVSSIGSEALVAGSLDQSLESRTLTWMGIQPMNSTTTVSRPQQERRKLYNRFRSKISPNSNLDRSLVSFQANRKTPFYGWFKYKEGFSADLVDSFIRATRKSDGILLDPFAGAGTALLVGRSLGWETVGIEVLPIGPYVIEARVAAEKVKPQILARVLDEMPKTGWAKHYDPDFSICHIPITKGAFTIGTEKAIAGFRSYCHQAVRNSCVKQLLDFACFSVLEAVSYTRKDGQYLRWDHRSGKDRVGTRFDKGDIPDFDTAISKKVQDLHRDITSSNPLSADLFGNGERPPRPGTIDLRIGSCLDLLPQMESGSVDLVFTSPPYCNRYDYTRTYALELVYLGHDAESVKRLRQKMLSCTVENRTKVEKIEAQYEQAGRRDEFACIVSAFRNQGGLHEALGILETLADADELNNVNVPKMIRNYFFEMCVATYELARVLRRGGRLVMVNDNVRYAGEEIPVDLILSDFAQQFGFDVKHIWTLTRGKGNSSQQMGAHGRSELRKCVYVWEKA